MAAAGGGGEMYGDGGGNGAGAAFIGSVGGGRGGRGGLDREELYPRHGGGGGSSSMYDSGDSASAQRHYAAQAAGERGAQRLSMVTPVRGGRSGGGGGAGGGLGGVDRRLAPSPPGEGSRKREEMAVAELLANSSRVHPEDMRNNGKRPHSAPDAGGSGGGGLRITNPDLLSPSGNTAMAHTPWDGEVNNLPDGLPAAKGRMTPTEEVSNDFAQTYGSVGGGGGGIGNRVSSNSSGSNANGSSAAPQAGGALHRNISQGQVAGALRLIANAKAVRDRNLAAAAEAAAAAAATATAAAASAVEAATAAPAPAAPMAREAAAAVAAAPAPAEATTGPDAGSARAAAPSALGVTQQPAAVVVPASGAAPGGVGGATGAGAGPETAPAAGVVPPGEEGDGAGAAGGGAAAGVVVASASGVVVPAADPTVKVGTVEDSRDAEMPDADVGRPAETAAAAEAAAVPVVAAGDSSTATAAAAAAAAAATTPTPSAAAAAAVAATSSPAAAAEAAGEDQDGDDGDATMSEAAPPAAAAPAAGAEQAASAPEAAPAPATVEGAASGVASASAASEGGTGGEKAGATAAGGGGGDVLLDLVNEVDKFGFTPLMLAASMQRAPGDSGGIGTGPDTAYSLCEALIAHGARRSAADTAGNTALHWAAWVGNHLVVGLLSANTTPEEINCKNEEGDSALHFASRWGGETAVRVLLAAGASADVRNSEGRNPLQVAGDGNASEGNPDMDSRYKVRREFFRQDPRNRTLILHHPDCLEHQPKSDWDWECPERVVSIVDLLVKPRAFEHHELEVTTDFSAVNTESLMRVHTGPYIKFVDSMGKSFKGEDDSTSVPFTPMVQQHLLKKGQTDVKPKDTCDTSFSKGKYKAGSLKAARRAAGAVTHAVDRVLAGKNRNAFCAVRPPGHHAGANGLIENSVSCGFCIFNNVAVGAMHALGHHRLDRVAIVDIDVHHGNGTEEICRAYPDPNRLFFFSVHLYDRGPMYEFFPGSGDQDDLQSNIINEPLDPLWKSKYDMTMGMAHRGGVGRGGVGGGGTAPAAGRP
ncbi:unnamed protein product, partial [Ectocarpus sp. 12 AP-2014]